MQLSNVVLVYKPNLACFFYFMLWPPGIKWDWTPSIIVFAIYCVVKNVFLAGMIILKKNKKKYFPVIL
jgi:hypothetical protein